MDDQNFTTDPLGDDVSYKKIDEKDIFIVCNDLSSKGVKITGANVRRVLNLKFNIGCCNKFLYDCIRSYKKSQRLKNTDFNSDTLEKELVKFDQLNLPENIDSLVTNAFHYALSTVVDYYSSLEASALTAQITQENEALRIQNNKLNIFISNLKTIVEYQYRCLHGVKLPENYYFDMESNSLMADKLIINEDNLVSDFIEKDSEINIKQAELNNDLLDADLVPPLLINKVRITAKEVIEYYHSCTNRGSLLTEIIALKGRLSNKRKPLPKDINGWIEKYIDNPKY